MTEVSANLHFTLLPKYNLDVGDSLCGQLLLRSSFTTPSRKKVKKLFHPDTRHDSFSVTVNLPDDLRGSHQGFIHVTDLLQLMSQPEQSQDGTYPKIANKVLIKWVEQFMRREGEVSCEDKFENARLMDVKIVGKVAGSGSNFWCVPLPCSHVHEEPLEERVITLPDGGLVGYVVTKKTRKRKSKLLKNSHPEEGVSEENSETCYVVTLARNCNISIPLKRVRPSSFVPFPGQLVILRKTSEKTTENHFGCEFTLHPPGECQIKQEHDHSPLSMTTEKQRKRKRVEETEEMKLETMDTSDSLSLSSSDPSESEMEDDEAAADNEKTSEELEAAKLARRLERKKRRLARKTGSSLLTSKRPEDALPTSENEFELWLTEGRLQSVFAWQAYIAFHASQGQVDKARSVIQRALQTISQRYPTRREDLLIACLNFEYLFGIKQQGSRQHYEALYLAVKQENLGVRVFKTVFDQNRSLSASNDDDMDSDNKTMLKRLDDIAKDVVKIHRQAADAWLLLMKARYLRYPLTHDKHPLDAVFLQAMEQVAAKGEKRRIQEKYQKYVTKLGVKPLESKQL